MFLISLTSCDNTHSARKDITDMNIDPNTEISTLYRRLFHNVEFDGHLYVLYSGFRPEASIVHSPNCKCNQLPQLDSR